MTAVVHVRRNRPPDRTAAVEESTNGSDSSGDRHLVAGRGRSRRTRTASAQIACKQEPTGRREPVLVGLRRGGLGQRRRRYQQVAEAEAEEGEEGSADWFAGRVCPSTGTSPILRASSTADCDNLDANSRAGATSLRKGSTRTELQLSTSRASRLSRLRSPRSAKAFTRPVTATATAPLSPLQSSASASPPPRPCFRRWSRRVRRSRLSTPTTTTSTQTTR